MGYTCGQVCGGERWRNQEDHAEGHITAPLSSSAAGDDDRSQTEEGLVQLAKTARTCGDRRRCRRGRGRRGGRGSRARRLRGFRRVRAGAGRTVVRGSGRRRRGRRGCGVRGVRGGMVSGGGRRRRGVLLGGLRGRGRGSWGTIVESPRAVDDTLVFGSEEVEETARHVKTSVRAARALCRQAKISRD